MERPAEIIWNGEQVAPQFLSERPEYFLGLDLGKSRDYSALAVIERVQLVRRDERDPVTQGFRRETRHFLRYLERVPLMTPYPDVVELVGRRASELAERGPATVVVDATGVGQPVLDLLKADALPARIVPVTITGGEAGLVDGGARVPKRDLIVGLQVAFQKRWLEVARRDPLAPALLEELYAVEMGFSALGRDQYGARVGHDDLVMAVALAWWQVRAWWPGVGGSARVV